MRRKTFLLGALATALLATSQAAFAAGTAFTQAAFDAARAAGKPVLVDITASWCPTCKAQQPILRQLTALPEFKDLVVLEVNFDTQKDVVRALGAQSQSTLIVYRGTTERGRSAGETQEANIRALLERATKN